MKAERKSEMEWDNLISKFKKSGKSPSEFCRKEGLKEVTFYKWRKLRGARKTKLPTKFIEIPKETIEEFKVELRFPNGLSLRIG